MLWLLTKNNLPRSIEHEYDHHVRSADFPPSNLMTIPTLTWPDIFIDASALNIQTLFANWPKTLTGKVRPLGCSAFGDLYFERESGLIERLDVLEGGINTIAANMNDFRAMMNSPEWQEVNLLTEGICLFKKKRDRSRRKSILWICTTSSFCR